MVEHGLRDYRSAKRKAAQKLGATGRGELPSNSEIEDARKTHQQIFHRASQDEWVAAMRDVARETLALLEPFRPLLAGALIDETVDAHSHVSVHAFSEPAEEIGGFLEARGISPTLAERRVRFSPDRERKLPAYRYLVGRGAPAPANAAPGPTETAAARIPGEVPVEIVVFSFRDRAHPPLSPVDGRPVRRLRLGQWEDWLAGTVDPGVPAR